uniref:Pecanex-like protein n=1 Tax=Panagrolaimus sp. JU765 TaxID=591449 RepID=A0AC34R214_9BILA
MTIGSHVAEIARQGIWASLTGGWCYEPANSLFCNTIHLYTWSLLLILPLLIGIFSSGTLTIQIFIGYVVFIVVFFALLKLIITYLHVVFDTTDPIIKYKNKKSLTNDVCRSLRSSFSAPFSNNDIEMMDLGRLRHNNDDEDDDNTQTRRNYIDEPEFAHVLFNNLKSIHEDDSSSSSCSKRSHNGLLDDKTSRIIEPFILPADSFELLPISSHNRRPSEGLTSSRQTTTFKRKLSEPSFEINSIKTRKSRGNSINSIRRVQSTTENIHPFQRRSNSSTYYLRDSKKERKRTTQSKTEIPLEKPNIEEDKPIITTDDGIIDDGQEPCCSKSLQKPKNDIIDDDVEEIIKIDDEGKDLSLVKVPSGMLKKMDRLGQHNLQEINGDSSDFKGKITKFLEELIDTIPETWDAIESVRQNYLERERERPIQRINRHRSIAPPGFSINEGTHVAYDHEDTTEGAVHSFQDENGTWWTYTFNEQGTGIAHPLGSTRAINEMFNQRKSESPNILKKNKVTRHRRHASAAGAVITTERFSIDSNQSGPSRISRISGQNNRRSESLTNDKPLASVTYIDMRPEDELELEKVSNNQEIINNQPQLPTETINERRTKRRRRRRARIHSSSSDEGGNEYISAVPSNIFYPSGQITTINPTEGMPFSRQFMSLAQLASRFAGGNQYPIITAPTNAHLSHHAISSLPLGNLGQQNNSSRRTTLESFADERRRRILTVGGDSSNETREYIRLQMNENDSGDNPQNHPSSASSDSILRNDLAQFGTGIRPRQSHLKPNYYYCLKPFTIGHGLQVKLDRLSVAALFDRNNSIISYFVDIFLAGMVTILATLLISRGIFEEISLLFFAFVVAGSQFSLLKSVQPDASSPVHGFNWLVAYSRPVYFIILSSIILLLDLWATKWNIEQKTTLYETWNWNPFTETKTSKIGIIIGIRDLFCLILLMLPIGFTIGLLPQISTLFMHIFEQIDMFLFGSTASFNLFSSFISLLRSIFVFGLLTLIGHFTYYFDGQSTQNAVFAVYISSIISLSYLMSRWSSNPLFLNILFKNLIPKNIFGCLIIDDDEIIDENEQENDINNDGKEIKMKNLKEKEQQQTTEIEIETQNGFTTNNQQQQQYSIMGGFKTNDPLPEILKNLLQERIFSDLFYIFINSLVIFGIHCTSVFTATQPYFEINISSLCI